MTAEPQKLQLFVATPCYGGMVTQRYMQCMFALLQFTAQEGIEVNLELIGHESLITRGRNTLVAKFLDDPRNTHLLFVDADVGFEVIQVLRMLSADRDVVAGMYPLKLIDWNHGALDRLEAGEALEHAPLRFVGVPCQGSELEKDGNLVTAEYAGTGFMLIRRQVFERLMKCYPHIQYKASHIAAIPSTSVNQFAFFDCIIDAETREYLSEDYAFCKRWRAIGGKVWLDTEGTLVHVGQHELMGSAKSRM
jgi:hypothetical protein